MKRPRAGSVRYLLGNAFYSLAYVEQGSQDAPPVVCVHGLTRTGRDFDVLAEALSDRFRVICPDLPGRGDSDWLPDAQLYQPPSYVTALVHLLAAIGRPVAWVGTSLGGIVGIAVAAAIGNPITRLVLNDVGPQIPSAAMRRIRDYVARTPIFPDQISLERHLREIHAPFGPLTDAQWEHLALTSARPLPDGRVAVHYDPGIAKPLRTAMFADVDLWPWWERISVPVLALRGEFSDLLPPATLARMARSGAQTLTVAGCGHAPALMDDATIGAVRAFLEAEPAGAGLAGAGSAGAGFAGAGSAGERAA